MPIPAKLNPRYQRALDELAGLTAELCQSPVSFACCFSDGKPIVMSKVGSQLFENELAGLPFFSFLRDSELFEVEDLSSDSRFAHHRLVVGDEGWRSFAAWPLSGSEGKELGALCVVERIPRLLSPPQQRSLRTLGGQASIILESAARTSKLKEREEQFSLYIRHNPAAVAMFDSEMHYIAASARWIDMFNPDVRDVAGRHHYEVNPDVPERWKKTHQRCLAGSCESCEEDGYETKDGVRYTVGWEIRPWHKEDGAVGGLIIFSQDVTEGKNYRTVFESASDAILVLDDRDIIIDANAAATRLLGYSKDEFSLLRRNELLLRAERDRLPAEKARVGAGRMVHSEWLCRHRDGRTVEVEASATVLPDGRKLIAGRDIGRRKERERRAKRLSGFHEMLGKIDTTLLRLEDVDELLHSICRLAVEDGFSLAWIGLLREGPMLEAWAATGDDLKEGGPILGEGFRASTRQVLETREALVLNASEGPFAEHPWMDSALQRGYGSFAAFPLVFEGKAHGSLGLFSSATVDYEEDELRLLTYLAANVSYVLETGCRRAEREASEERHARQRDALITLASEQSLQAEGLENTLRRITELAARTLDVERVGIWLETPRERIECADLFLLSTGSHRSGRDSDLVLPRAAERSGYKERHGIGAVLEVPILCSGVHKGVILNEHIGPSREWTTDEKTFAVAMSHLVSLALEQHQRRQAESALVKSQETLSRALKMAKLGHWEYDVANEVFLFNDHFYNLLRTTAEREGGYEMRPQDYAQRFLPMEWIPIVAEETRKAIEASEPHYSRQLEHPIIFGDSQPGYLAVRIFAQKDGQGKTIKTYGVNQDITERRKAEEEIRRAEHRFRSLIEHSADVLVLANAELEIAYASPAVAAVEGFEPETVVGRSLLWNTHPNDIARLQKTLERLRNDPDEVLSAQFRHRHKAGHWLWLEGVFTNLLHDPAVRSIVANYRDVTARRQLEEQLLQSQKMEAVGRLAGGVAHDFNNILTVIQGYSGFLMSLEELDEEISEAASEIGQAAERAAHLTHKLLAFSRKQVMQSGSLDLNVSVSSLTSLLERILGEDIRLELKLHSEPLVFRGDAGMVDQILINLVVNAREAMPQGGHLLIETGSRTFSEEESTGHTETFSGEHVFLRVTDTGQGIAPQDLSSIFEPFFTTKPPGKGTGLGLSTVFGLVKQHNGSVDVRSVLNEGTTFEIVLPVSDGIVETTVTGKSTLQPRGGRETILLVEDEPSVRKLTCTVLTRAGYRVLEASGPAEAMETFSAYEQPIQLLFTDIVMPGGNGLELAKELQRRDANLKVLLTSGYSTEVAGRELVLGDNQDFLPKPSTPKEMLCAVRACLESS